MKAKKWLRENSKTIPMSQKKDRTSSPNKEQINIDIYNQAIQDLEIYMMNHPEIDWTKNQNNKNYQNQLVKKNQYLIKRFNEL